MMSYLLMYFDIKKEWIKHKPFLIGGTMNYCTILRGDDDVDLYNFSDESVQCDFFFCLNFGEQWRGSNDHFFLT